MGGGRGDRDAGGEQKATRQRHPGDHGGSPGRTNSGLDCGPLAAYDADEFAGLLGIADV
jgi:hypothetical protein